MSDPFIPQVQPKRPPGNVPNLNARVNQYARDRGLAAGRVYQRVYSELFFGVLAEALTRGIIPMYLLKGGMALELRFGISARASKDVDIGIISGGDDLLAVFDRVLAVGFAGFTFRRRDKTIHLERVATYRLQVQIQYAGRPFGTLAVDLNEADGETASDLVTTSVLTALGLPGPLSVPVLDSHLQIAHKLHGATEPSRADYENRRYRDLLDVLVISRDMGAAIDFRRLRAIAIAEFARREHHRVWPPTFEFPESWREPLESEAKANDFPVTDPAELVREFVAFIARIEGIAVSPRHEYRFLNLQEIISGGGTLAPEAQAQLESLAADGWNVRYIAPHRHYPDQFQAFLERELPSTQELPRLQLRVKSESPPNQQVSLFGSLRNESDQPADKVRVFMTGVDRVIRLGTVTRGDGDLDVRLYYEDQLARTQRAQFSGVIVQYSTDGGAKVEQTGLLDVHGPDASGRLTYSGTGLGPARVIERFTYRHDPLDDL